MGEMEKVTLIQRRASLLYMCNKIGKGWDVKMTEFHLLSSDERLGFYNCVEILHAFTIAQRTNVCRNYFTLFSLEEHYYPAIKEEYLTPKPFSEKEFKNEKIDLGIIRKTVDLTTAECLYEQLYSAMENHASEIDLGCGIIKIGELERIPKAFVRAAGFDEEVPLNKILKNNFENGSYLLEYFDTEKTLWRQLPKEIRDRLSVKLFRYMSETQMLGLGKSIKV